MQAQSTQEKPQLHWMDWRNDLELLRPLLPKGVGGAKLEHWISNLDRRPAQGLLGVMAAATLGFYQAEKDHNPKVNTLWDALLYCSTCISVGYSDIFARTPAGKVIGSTLMMFGPALAAKALDGPIEDRPETTQKEILSTLKQIVELLEEQKNQNPQEQPSA